MPDSAGVWRTRHRHTTQLKVQYPQHSATAHATLSASFIGGNLGVIIARQLVQLMAGQFKFSAALKAPAHFSIAFNPQHSQSAHTEAEAVLHQQHILIIDSNMLSQRFCSSAQAGAAREHLLIANDAVALLRNKALQGQHLTPF